MTPLTRSTLNLDLKDLTPRSSRPHIGRIGLVTVSVIALISTVISINSPSASVANLDIPGTAGIQRAIDQVAPNTVESRMAPVAVTPRSASPEVTSQNIAGTDAKLETIDTINIRNAVIATRKPGSASPLTETGLPATGLETAIEYKMARRSAADEAAAEGPANDGAADDSSSEPESIAVYPDDRSVSRQLRIQLASLAPMPIFERRNRLSSPVIADPATFTTEIPDALQLASIRTDALLTDPAVMRAISPGAAGAAETASPLPPAAKDPLEAALTEGDWTVETVRKKDTMSQVFERAGLGISEAYALVKLEHADALNKIRPGDEIHLITTPAPEGDKHARLERLKYRLDRFSTLLVQRSDDGFRTDIIRREPEIRYRSAQATIWDSLLGSAREASIPRDVVYSLATIFGWQVDFAKDIQGGEQYTVIYEELVLDGDIVGEGEVVAAELVTGKQTLRAIRHEDGDGQVTYYSPDGTGLQGSFLRTPVKFARITSKFSKKRLHPIQNKWKAHNGVDYGAPMKTPVLSTGDGVVHFAGTRKGYGRTIILRHGEQYETLYAHLNHFRKGLSKGDRVKQGEVIGYVGRTGWATGPHLHYEFRVDGKHMNPLTVELPKSLPIDPRYLKDFRKNANRWVAALEDADRIPLARLDP